MPASQGYDDMKLSNEDFAQVIQATPLVSIDFVIRNPGGECLLGLRKNEPAKGFWFNLGGRILKNETIENAQARIFHEETGLQLERDTLKFLSVSDHIYQTNVFRNPNFGTHYVCVTYEITLDSSAIPKTDAQHCSYQWRSEEKILIADDVHENTKLAFRDKAA
ncbi:MAG: GDP-mannose mannosyl hydrolase [Litorimonas sp.]